MKRKEERKKKTNRALLISTLANNYAFNILFAVELNTDLTFGLFFDLTCSVQHRITISKSNVSPTKLRRTFTQFHEHIEKSGEQWPRIHGISAQLNSCDWCNNGFVFNIIVNSILFVSMFSCCGHHYYLETCSQNIQYPLFVTNIYTHTRTRFVQCMCCMCASDRGQSLLLFSAVPLRWLFF